MLKKKVAALQPAERTSLLSHSSDLLDFHLGDLLEAVDDVHNLAGVLKVISKDDRKRNDYEGRFYAALAHLHHHLKPAITEWDRVVDRMPNDD